MEHPARTGALTERRRVDGVVLIDKPLRLSSNAALQRVKRALRARKAGHTGTLDPLATGLLPICLGEATKFSQGLLDSDKIYRTEIRLGVVTETGDVEGRVLRECPVETSRNDLDQVLGRFRGPIEQVPHRYSAIKREGRRLYDYARSGESISVAPRSVRIDELDVEEWSPPRLILRVRCSKGTYIRSLAEDIGDALGCGAHVAALRRLSSGHFQVADAVDVETFEAMTEPERDARILPLSTLIGNLPRLTLNPDAAARFGHGLAVDAQPDVIATDEAERLIAVFAERHDSSVTDFVGVGRRETRGSSPLIIPVRLLSAQDSESASGNREKRLFG